MTLTAEATAAHAATQVAADAAADAGLRALWVAATAALRAVLVRPDGTTLSVSATGLTEAHADADDGLVVWRDPDGLLLAAQLEDDQWHVLLVRKVDGQFALASEPLTSLADLGAALAAVR